MPLTATTGRALQEALRHLSPDPFMQSAILRLYINAPDLLNDTAVAALNKASRRDDQDGQA